MNNFLKSRRFVVYIILFGLYLVGAEQKDYTITALYQGVFVMLVMLGTYEIGFRMIAAMIGRGKL